VRLAILCASFVSVRDAIFGQLRRFRLRSLLACFESTGRLFQIIIADDVIPIEDGARLVPGDFHAHFFGIPGSDQRCLSKISKCLSGWGLFLLHNSR